MHPEPLTGRAELVADEVRAALFEALGPAWRAALACLETLPDVARPEEILLAVQLDPPVVRVVREAAPERPAVELAVARFTDFPGDGAALADATRAYVAGVLSAFDDMDAADRAARFAYAVHGKGGFVLVVKPALGESRLFLAKPGEDLSTAVDLGGIGEGRPVLH